MRKALGLRWAVVAAGAAMLLVVASACTKEVIKEVPVEKIVTKEVIKEVPVEKIVTKEVVREVQLPGQTVVVEKEVIKEVVKEVPVEKIVEVMAEKRTGPTYGGVLRIATGSDQGGTNDLCVVKGQRSTGFYGQNLLIYDWARGAGGSGENDFFMRMGAGSDTFDTGAVADRWDVPNPLQYRFHIREGLQWQNKNPTFGRKVTTEDVEGEMNRILECRWPRHDFTDKITADDTDGDGMADSVSFHTNMPIAFWAYEYAHGPYFKVIPPESVEAGLDDYRNFSGTGPFMVEEYVPASHYSYVRNPDFYLTWTEEGKEYQIPFIDKVIDIIIPTEATRVAALRTGKIDSLESVRPAQIEGLAKTHPDLPRTGPLERPFAWYMPMNKPPFDDVRVRRAMNMAIDRQVFIDALLGGEGEILSYPFGPEQAAFFEPLENMPDDVQEYFMYDSAKADALLDEAGLTKDADGTRFEIEVMVSANSEALIEATEIAIGMWEAVGVKVTMDLEEATAWRSRLFANEYDFSATVAAPADNTLNNFRAGHQWNQSNMNDPEFLAMWEETLGTTDSAELVKNQKATARKFLELAPGIIMPAGHGADYWQPWLKGYAGQRATGHYEQGQRWAYIWLDKDLRYESTGFKD